MLVDALEGRSSVVKLSPSSLFVDPQLEAGFHLCPNEVLTQSQPLPPSTATFYVSLATTVDAADSLGALTAPPSSPESV